MAEEEEVLMEVEAVEAVYGDDCVVVNRYPPHLRLHLKPRTADVDSQQFVEAAIELQAGPQYPSDPPCVDIIGFKGLDEKRQTRLSNSLQDKARELTSCLMLVALCEEAVEVLSSMNHPEGDCPLCLYPLVPEDEQSKSEPFMKLMSCFHCFHCECFIRWLKWFLRQNEANFGTSNTQSSPFDKEERQPSDLRQLVGGSTGSCPVCRKVFLAKDIEHVLNLVGSHGVDMDSDEKVLGEELLKCHLESNRRQKFETILRLQQEQGGLIEPPKGNVLFSRISLHDLVREVALDSEVSEQSHRNQVVTEETESNDSPNQTHQTMKRRQRGHTANVEPGSSGAQIRPSTSQHQRSGARKHGRNNSKVQAKQWTRKE